VTPNNPNYPPDSAVNSPKVRASAKQLGLRDDTVGCLEVVLFFLILMSTCIAGFVGINDGNAQAQGAKGAGAGLGNLPALGVKQPAATTPTTATTAVPAPTATTEAPVAATTPPQQTPAQAPQQQAPAPPPTAPPLPSCGFGNGISVSGGNPGTLGAGGGSFTVASIPVTISVSGVPPCGKHYRLEYSGGGAKGSYNGLSACTFDGPSVTINSQFMSVGDTVSVTLQIPPNSCGD
jgi:hypothetical protein